MGKITPSKGGGVPHQIFDIPPLIERVVGWEIANCVGSSSFGLVYLNFGFSKTQMTPKPIAARLERPGSIKSFNLFPRWGK